MIVRWYKVRRIPTVSLCEKVYNAQSHLHLESIFAQPDVQRLRFASKNLTKSHYKEDRNGKNDAKESYLGSTLTSLRCLPLYLAACGFRPKGDCQHKHVARKMLPPRKVSVFWMVFFAIFAGLALVKVSEGHSCFAA